MSTKINLMPRLYFSYSQFLVRDLSAGLLRCPSTEQHTAQGFAREESIVYFGTLLEFGHADVAYELRSFVPDESYERVIAVPFTVTTGKVIVDGPEENKVQRLVELPNGNYRLVAAQRATDDEEEVIDLFFEKLDGPLRQSSIIVADKQLEVPSALLETADIA